MNEEHKPCPFCGDELAAMARYAETGTYWVMCRECKATGPVTHSESAAWAAWDRRAGE